MNRSAQARLLDAVEDCYACRELDAWPQAALRALRGLVRALTPREREVLETIGPGATNSEAAAQLGVGERTVEKHVEHVYEKLGVPNRLAAGNAYHRRRS